MDIHDFIEHIETKEDFIQFLSLFRKDFNDHRDLWENPNLESYLEALEASATDIDGSYHNQGMEFPKKPSWRLLAKLLFMGAYYE